MEDEVIENRALPLRRQPPTRRRLPATTMGLPDRAPQARSAHDTQHSNGYLGYSVDDICVFGEAEVRDGDT